MYEIENKVKRQVIPLIQNSVSFQPLKTNVRRRFWNEWPEASMTRQ